MELSNLIGKTVKVTDMMKGYYNYTNLAVKVCPNHLKWNNNDELENGDKVKVEVVTEHEFLNRPILGVSKGDRFFLIELTGIGY